MAQTGPRELTKPIETESKRDVTDQQLLGLFVAHRDETAFARIVQRHGGTVWGVCRRLLNHEQDSEDAFQAVFLILARKAASIRKGEAVGSWLYGVAYRVALKARTQMARRNREERMSAEVKHEPPPWTEASCREFQRFLDDEVQRLPEKYRAPFVLCCLEGLSRADAARELGLKEVTLSGRLALARQKLHSRLARRGVALSAALTALALSQHSAALAAPMLQATAEAVLAPAGKAAVSPAAALLADRFLRAQAWARGRTLLALAVALSALLGLWSAALHFGLFGWEEPFAASEPDTFVPPPMPLGTVVDEQVLAVAFSADGRRLATAGGRQYVPGQLRIWDVATRQEVVTLRGIAGIRTVTFSPDRSTLATDAGQPCQYQNEYHPAAPTRSGLLRLTRKGGEVTFSVAERPDGGFREVYERELGPEDVKRFEVAAYPGQSQEVVDVRLRDVRVRAPEMPKRLDPLVAEAPPPRGLAVWLSAGLIGSGLIFALWWARRRSSP